eukprot:CAMPEP_0170188760 /NCGR_PEP_ID=MMETSP0040_2-20121228/45131_1 /TAXON_ID=641309 /ORGANISM="Lotharella oceanica, Strain CCMP622" /LENGTH=35 /DNA_ID= /DNA_START= /DNA_END= /DNA_ORIENTATION=
MTSKQCMKLRYSFEVCSLTLIVSNGYSTTLLIRPA